MAQNQEQIEARLCDYLEGTLNETERTEIEKHLAGNPQHRKLMDELLKTRQMMRQLPRAKAPADVSETLQGQLERSVLLGVMPEETPPSGMRIGLWSRLGGIAAVLLLALGLGAATFYVLRNTRSRPELASLPARELSALPSTLPADDETPVPALASTATGRAASETGPLASVKVDNTEPMSPASINPASITPASTTPSSITTSSITPAPATPSPITTTDAGPVPAAGALGTIELAPPAQAPMNNAFANGAPVVKQAEDSIFGSSAAGRLKSDGNGNDVEYLVCEAPRREVTRYLADNNITWTVEPMPEPLALSANQHVLSSRANQNSLRLQRTAPDAVDAAKDVQAQRAQPQTAPANDEANGSEQDRAETAVDAPAASQSVGQSAGRQMGAAPANAQDNPTTAPAIDTMICARNLTRQQVVELRANFQKADASRDGSAAGALNAEATPSSESALAKRALERVENKPAVSPSTAPAADELRSPTGGALNDAHGEAAADAKAEVSPGAGSGGISMNVAKVPATQPLAKEPTLGQINPTTVPALPAEQRVDVVIVVKDVPAPATTQPALERPSTRPSREQSTTAPVPSEPTPADPSEK
jgi:hypothetical protein